MNIPRLTTATSGLASEAVLQIAAPFHQYRTPQCTEPVKAQPSADRSTEMNEYTRETEKPANEGKTLTLPSRLIEAAAVTLGIDQLWNRDRFLIPISFGSASSVFIRGEIFAFPDLLLSSKMDQVPQLCLFVNRL